MAALLRIDSLNIIRQGYNKAADVDSVEKVILGITGHFLNVCMNLLIRGKKNDSAKCRS